MKRLWIALAILLGIFGASLLSAHWLSGFTGQLTQLLERSEQAAKEGDWQAAAALTGQAARNWQQRSGGLHVVLRHADIDQVHISFEEVQQLLDSRELGEWSRGYISAAARYRLIGGYPDGTFRPGENITRGEAAILIVNAIGTPVMEAGEHVLGDVSGNVTITASGARRLIRVDFPTPDGPATVLVLPESCWRIRSIPSCCSAQKKNTRYPLVS